MDTFLFEKLRLSLQSWEVIAVRGRMSVPPLARVCSNLVVMMMVMMLMIMMMVMMMIMMVMKVMMLMMMTVTCMTCEPKVTRHKILRLTLPATELHKADYRDHNENRHHDCYHEKMTFAVMITTKENPHLPPMAETT